jgi:putative hydrolase of the HAD superfamily
MKNNIIFPKGILFDMDGVLLITTQSSDQSWQLVSQQFAPKLGLPPQILENALRESRSAYHKDIEHNAQMQQRDRLKPFETRQETVEGALKQVSREDRIHASQIVRTYETIRDEHRHLAPHTLETLQKLRYCGLALALVSNGNATYQRQKIKQYHLAPFFDSILIEEEFGIAKPDQRIFLAALNNLHITSQEAWMIGDDLAFDIAPSQQLGMLSIWCDQAQRGLPEGCIIHPNWIIHTLPELFDLLEDARTSV